MSEQGAHAAREQTRRRRRARPPSGSSSIDDSESSAEVMVSLTTLLNQSGIVSQAVTVPSSGRNNSGGGGGSAQAMSRFSPDSSNNDVGFIDHRGVGRALSPSPPSSSSLLPPASRANRRSRNLDESTPSSSATTTSAMSNNASGGTGSTVTSPRTVVTSISPSDSSHRRKKLATSRGRTKHRVTSSRPASPGDDNGSSNNPTSLAPIAEATSASSPAVSNRRRANTMYEMRDKRPSAELLAAVAEHEAAEKEAAARDSKKASSATTPLVVVPTPTVPPTTAANIHADAPRKQDSRSVQFATPPKAPTPAAVSSSRLTPVHNIDDDLASSLPNQPIFRDSRAKLVHSVTDFMPPSPSSSDDRGGAFALFTRAFKGGKKPTPPPLDARYVLDFYSKTSPVRLLGEIGRGGSMAIVYRACISDFMVACKTYDLEVTDESAREALLREFRIVRSLAPHDNIIPYFALDQVSSPTHWRLYMPLYDMTLRQLLNESRACAMSRRASAVDDSSAAWTSFNAQLLSIASTSSLRRTQTNNSSMLRVLTVLERIEAASQVAAALSHAHACHVLHRDVKAENVLVRLGVNELVQCVLCDFGEARELPKAAGLERSMSCFPEADHELLTARGFMSLADVEAVAKRGEALPLVASFDSATEQLVYDAPRAVVLNDTTPALIEFVSSTGGNDCIGLLATPNHDMLVRRGGSFAKVAAERLVGQRVEVMTGARRGAGGCGAQLRGRAECRALGDALARGTAASLPDWVWQLSADALRCVFDAAGKSVVVSSVALRDDLVRAALHAGLSASFVADAGAWRVTILSAAATAVCVARVDEASIVSRKSARSWCFSMPRGHVVVRRVVRDECGRVLQAMVPTIQGNSNVGTSEFMAPETISTTGTRRMAYDEKSDMFSYGMLLFELITNEIPFRREQVSPFDLLDHIKARARPEMPHGVVNSHTEGLYQLHLDCTQHDPIRRISAQVAYQRSLKLAAAERLSPTPI